MANPNNLFERMLRCKDPRKMSFEDEKDGYYLSTCALSTNDIPELLEIASQWGNPDWLHSLDSKTRTAKHADMLPVIAWRCLANLKDPLAIEPLVKLLGEFTDKNDFWIFEDLPIFLGKFGVAALAPLRRLVEDTTKSTFIRSAAIDAIDAVECYDSQNRAAVIDVFRNLLRAAETTDIRLNSSIVRILVDLRSTEAAEEIERAYAVNRVDVGLIGTWEKIRSELNIEGIGLKMPDEPYKENYPDFGTHNVHGDYAGYGDDEDYNNDDEDYYDDDEDYYDEEEDDDQASVTEAWILAFRVSPEGQEVIAKQGQISWIWSFFDFHRNYSDTILEAIDSDVLFDYLLAYCPRNVSVEPERGAEIIFELTKFFEFASRELNIEHSKEIVDFLQEANLFEDMRAELADPANFGMAKSICMEGMREGYDVNSQEGLDAFIKIYNQRRLQQLAAEQAVKTQEGTPRSFSNTPIRVEKTGRNEPCPCGSGKKYKKCCLRGGVD